MNRIVHIENNQIVNVSLAPDDWELPSNCMLESEALALGLARKVDASFKTWPSRVEFWDEFTLQEKVAITNASDAMIKYFLSELYVWIGQIWSTDERVVQGLNALVSLQIIDSQRKAEILGS